MSACSKSPWIEISFVTQENKAFRINLQNSDDSDAFQLLMTLMNKQDGVCAAKLPLVFHYTLPATLEVAVTSCARKVSGGK